MADGRFKIKTDMALKHCSLSVPPRAAKGSQMVKKDVHNTSNCKCLHICSPSHLRAKRVKDFKASTSTSLFTNIEWYCSSYQWFSKFKNTSCWLIFLCSQNMNLYQKFYFQHKLVISGNLYVYLFSFKNIYFSFKFDLIWTTMFTKHHNKDWIYVYLVMCFLYSLSCEPYFLTILADRENISKYM